MYKCTVTRISTTLLQTQKIAVLTLEYSLGCLVLVFVCADLSPDVQAWLKGDGAFAQAAKKSVLKPRTMMDIDGVDHFVRSEDQEIPDGIKLDFDANQDAQDVSMSPMTSGE